MKSLNKHLLLFISLALIYLLIAFYVCSLWPKTSDQASYFLAGMDFLHGNWRLKNWVLTPPDFWTSDIPLSAFLGAVWHLAGHPSASPVLLMLQPAILWTGLICSAFYLVFQRLKNTKHKTGAVLILLCALAFPLMHAPMAYFITLSAIHIGSLIYGLWAIHHTDRFLKDHQHKSLLFAAILLCLGSIGDPLFVITTGGAVLLFSIISKYSPLYLRVQLVFAAILSILTAKIILWTNIHTGGFHTEILETRFATWDQLNTNLSISLRCILLVFGADPSGHSLSSSTPELLRLILTLFIIIALFSAVKITRKHKQHNDTFCVLLGLTALLNFVALTVSNRIALDGNPIAVARYLFPLWVSTSCIAALYWNHNRKIAFLAGIALFSTLWADIRDLPAHSTGILTTEDNQLLSRLEKDAPSFGIGSWWSSVNLEVASLGKVHIYPGMQQSDGSIMPFVHIRKNMDWASLKGQNFFVLIPHPTETFTEKAALKTFGAPTQTIIEGRYTILIYRTDHLFVGHPDRT
ncbi:hypothetical protein [Swingsia samuiensis]|uniref:Glycosyltransferase RgtA/B/C/D-like domain-containing protein n=1 Tax=Swingsia samuiensis TaxID=1293412 RepID=A0A4Y6UF17_9PROT|nr:hypothetical protein [Swingsia samuiensis]QDH16139.1 hypothetical protein E3D00_00045 [Swingsia samuiensis]